MEIKKKNQHFSVDIVMNEAEVQSLVGVFEELNCLYNRSRSEIGGLRGDIYRRLREVLETDGTPTSPLPDSEEKV